MPKAKAKKEPEVTEREVELSKAYTGVTTIIMKHHPVEFTNDKAVVSPETERKLKEQGFIK